MKKTLLFFIYSLFFILGSKFSYGQAFTQTYAFGSVVNGSGGLTDPTPVPAIPGATFGSFSAVLEQQPYATPVAPATNPGASGRFSFGGWPPGATDKLDVFTGSIDLNQYYQVTISPTSGNSVTLTNMSFTFQRSATGVRQYSVRSSIDNYATNLPATITTTTTSSGLSVVTGNIFQSTDNLTTAQMGSTITFDASTFAKVTTPVTLRFYAWNAEGSGGTFSIDDVVINGSTQVAVVNPTLAVTPTSLDFGTTQTTGTTSAPQSFTLTGTNIPSAGATVSVAAPYSISTTSGGTYSTSLTLTQAQAASQVIYVEFSPTSTTATTGTVTVSTGTVSATVSLTGTGNTPVPTLAVTPTSLAFGNVNQGNQSVKSFALSGSNLTTNSATVAATAPYTVSRTSTSGFGTTAVFTAAEIAAGATVYVQFAPTTTGAANSTITVTDADVTTGPTVAVTGTGVVPVLTATPTTLAFNNQTILTTAVKTYTLSGANLTGATTVTATAPFTVSKDNVTFAASISYSAAELSATTAPTVYVKYAPITLVTSSSNVVNTTSGIGAAIVNVTVTGTGVAAPVPTLTVTPSTLTYSGTFVGSTSAAQSYTISGINLTGATTITAAAPYIISKTAGGTYGNTLTYSVTDLITPQTVYVEFSPTVIGAGGVNNSSIANATAGGSTQLVTVNGTGVGIPVLTVAPSALTFSQVIGGTSAPQSYTLSGAYITDNTTVTVAAPYSISKTATGTYGTSLTYSISDLTTPQTVYVQFSPTVIGSTANAGNAINVSAGAASVNVALNGTGLGVPTLTVSPASLTFNQASNITAVQSYTLTGANITAPTTVTTAAPYGISKTATGTFGTSLIYAVADLATPQTVYVQFIPTAIGAATGAVANVSAGATTQTVVLNGTATNAPPTLAAIADVNICYTPAQQSIALTGISAVESSQTISTLSVISSNGGLFSSLGVTPVTGSTANILYTIAAGQSGTAVVTVIVKDNGGTANGGSDTYQRTFNITVNAPPAFTITSDAPNSIAIKGNTVTLTASGAPSGSTYSWAASSDFVGSTSAAITQVRPKATATYTLTVTNATGCSTVQTITINVSNALKLETGNLLTPNGDGINDYWIIRNIDLYTNNTVKVFDKTGKLVFAKSNYANDWNGYYNGVPLAQGTYYYVVDLGNGKPYKGYISVVRD